MSEIENPRSGAILFDLGGVLMNFGGLQRLAELTGEETARHYTRDGSDRSGYRPSSVASVMPTPSVKVS
ncbi:MAG: hypothetical protein ACRCYU_06130 [Nocardioides sp.]